MKPPDEAVNFINQIRVWLIEHNKVENFIQAFNAILTTFYFLKARKITRCSKSWGFFFLEGTNI